MTDIKENITISHAHSNSIKSIKWYSCTNCEVYRVDKIENCECSNEYLYTLCDDCNTYIQSFQMDSNNEEPTTKQIRDSLYFVLHDNDVGGPYTTAEIIKLYVCRKFPDNQIQIMSASKQEGWCQVILPNKIMPAIFSHKCILCKLKKIDESMTTSDREQQTIRVLDDMIHDNNETVYTYLYKRLIIDVLKGELKQIIIPKQEPKYNHTAIWLLGVIIVAAFTIVVALHTIATLLFAICVMKILVLMRDCCGCADDIFFYHNDSVQNLMLFIAYCGMIICPLLICEALLAGMDHKWNEYQSWMIAYVCWGVVSFATSLAYFYSEIKRSERKIYQACSWFIFLVIGLDFGEIDIFDAFAGRHVDIVKLIFKDSFKHKMIQITILFLFPSLFSLLPALVVGFAANFFLEEKFLLKCGDDITNTELCFDDTYGCCDVLSSHDYQNSYVFIGGIGSTCVTLWGFIRISAYLMASAFPSLSTYSKRIS